MKKHILSKTIILIGLGIILSGCGEEEIIWVPTVEDFTLTGNVTNSGITIGSSFEEFSSAYAQFPIQSLDAEGNWQPYSFPDSEENPDAGKENMTLMTSYFFVDNNPMTTAELLIMTGKTADELNAYLASKEFLDEHDVVFHYIIFELAEGVVTSLDDNYLSYDTELFLD